MGDAFLLVEDDAVVARSLRGVLRAFGGVAIAATAAEARSALNAQPWAGVVLDVKLPDGDGLDLLTESHVPSPVLVFTGWCTREVANRAHDLGAELAIKPVDAERIRAWARRAVGDDAWLERELEAWRRRYGLSAAELHVLELAVRMHSREEIARERHISIETVKSHVAALLRKTGDAGLKEAAIRVLWRRHER